MPTGAPPGDTGHFAKTFMAFVSTTATWSLSSNATYALPLPSVANDSGLPPSCTGASALPVLGSTSGEIGTSTPASPQATNTFPQPGSKKIASASSAVLILPSTVLVLVSNM